MLILLVIFLCHASLGYVSSARNNTSATNSFEGLLGSSLYRWEGGFDRRTQTSSGEVLQEATSKLLGNKKVVAVYFSASW
jgi:hypothetical protein